MLNVTYHQLVVESKGGGLRPNLRPRSDGGSRKEQFPLSERVLKLHTAGDRAIGVKGPISNYTLLYLVLPPIAARLPLATFPGLLPATVGAQA